MRRVRAVLVRLAGIFSRSRADRDLADELEGHVQMHADDNVRNGMAPDAARRDAMMKLGGIDQAKERYRDRRGFPALDHLWIDVRHAARALAKRPILILTTTLSIGVGAGVNVAIYGALYHVLFDSGIMATDRDRLLRVGPEASYPLFADLRASGVFQDLAARQGAIVTWRHANGTSSLNAGVVSANFFDLLGVRPIIGQGLDASNELGKGGPDRAIITYEFWRRRLGADPGVIGQTLTLDGWPYTIAGVLPKEFSSPVGPLLAPPLYVPISTRVAVGLDSRTAPQLDLLARMRPGATVEETRAALRVEGQRIEAVHPEEQRGLSRSIRASSSLGLIAILGDDGDFAPEIQRLILGAAALLYAIALLVLLTACANVAGLLTARAVERAPEIALRLALGATRARMMQQLLAESTLVAALGCAAGALLWIVAATVLPTLPAVVDSGTNLVPGPLPLAYCLTLVILVSLACGLVPAFAANQVSPARGLRNRSTSRRWTIGRLLVAAQVAVCFTLLAGAFVVIFSLARQSAGGLGFDVDHTVAVRLRLPRRPQTPERAARTLFDWRSAIERVPGVMSVSTANYLPLGWVSGIWASTVRQPRPTGDVFFDADIQPVGPRYLETMGITLERGREFVDADVRSSYGGTAAIVNHTLAERYLTGVDPIGQELILDQDPGRGRDRRFTIVGVARDSKIRTLSEKRQVVVYLPSIDPTLVARVRGPAAASVAATERTLADFDPTAAVTVRPLSDELSSTLLPARIATMLLAVVGSIGLLLAMVGLHGIVACSVNRRMFEIGIRIALGATRAAIVNIVLADAVAVVGAGSIAGGVLAFGLIRTLWPLLTGDQSAMTPTALLAVLLLLMSVGALACLRPARRAATTDPIVALRHD